MKCIIKWKQLEFPPNQIRKYNNREKALNFIQTKLPERGVDECKLISIEKIKLNHATEKPTEKDSDIKLSELNINFDYKF